MVYGPRYSPPLWERHGSRQGTQRQEQEAGWSHHIHTQGAESEEEVGLRYQASRPVANDSLALLRLHSKGSTTFPNRATSRGPSFQTHEPRETFHIHTNNNRAMSLHICCWIYWGRQGVIWISTSYLVCTCNAFNSSFHLLSLLGLCAKY